MRTAYILHSEKMGAKVANTLWHIMKPLIESKAIEVIEVPVPKKAGTKNPYPDWFEPFWKKLPVRSNKPETLEACLEVLKQGYTVFDIEKGIPGYARDEARRSKSPDYQKHSPHRWIKKHRFLDDHNHSPDAPIKSNRDITISMFENSIGFCVTKSNRDMLWSAINEGNVTCSIIEENKGKWADEPGFIRWLSGQIS